MKPTPSKTPKPVVKHNHRFDRKTSDGRVFHPTAGDYEFMKDGHTDKRRSSTLVKS